MACPEAQSAIRSVTHAVPKVSPEKGPDSLAFVAATSYVDCRATGLPGHHPFFFVDEGLHPG